ncbi:MAG: T9SS type A sorting domain-containing protein [Bacteroidetes bacterium]|nr:T9SS type A sorting domain-containing protein [Bacteroidota bacterium]
MLPPWLPNGLDLDCGNNLITELTDLPDSIGTLRIDSNPIACLPEMHTINQFSWANTNIHCLPNYSRIYNANPSLNNVPLCQPSDNCPSMWNITGQVFFDADSSCTQDTGEISLKNIPVVLDSAGLQLQEFLTDNYGRYSFRTGQGNYTIRIDTAGAPFRVVCPSTFFETALLNVVDSMDTVPSFGLLCNYGFDLTARSISPIQMFRPGFQNTIYLDAGEGMSFSGINCTSAISGSVRAILSSLVSFVSPANGALTPTSVNGDTIIWNISDFSMIDPVHDFNIVVHVSVSATLNDTICVLLDVLPAAGDIVPANNSLSQCFPVRGAVDPNEKYMSPSGSVDSSAQWFTFTIFFQNVGNAPAEDIYILDTLDQNLDATTFTYLSSSHEAITQLLPGNILRFNYPDINLVDSMTNEPGSHGYVCFRVKRKENTPPNAVISNTANIYFDYNAPVETNVVSATLHFCPPMTLNYSANDSICPGTCINFQNLSLNGISYQWQFPGASPDTSSALNPVNICYAHGGFYPVTLIANCLSASDTLTIDSFITVLPGAAFISTQQNICPGSCISFINNSIHAISFQWSFQGAIPAVSTQADPVNICYENPGSYIVALVATDSSCSDFISYSNYITVFQPGFLSILQSGDTLFATPGFVSYQWYLNDTLLSGANNYYYVVAQNGDYNVVCSDPNGCNETAEIVNVMTGLPSFSSNLQFDLYPNPAGDYLTITNGQFILIEPEIYNPVGELICKIKYQRDGNFLKLRTSELPSGIYFLRLQTYRGFNNLRFVKQ